VFITFNINHSSILPLMALNSLYCADVPLSNYSLTRQNLYFSYTKCEKRFFALKWLVFPHEQLNIHADKYKCREFGKCWCCSNELAVHMKSHSGEKQFERIVCNERFTTSCHLAVNSRVHSGVKHVICVRKHLVGLQICPLTWESTWEINHTSVQFSPLPDMWRSRHCCVTDQWSWPSFSLFVVNWMICEE